jgi:hypothetical protein
MLRLDRLDHVANSKETAVPFEGSQDQGFPLVIEPSQMSGLVFRP